MSSFNLSRETLEAFVSHVVYDLHDLIPEVNVVDRFFGVLLPLQISVDCNNTVENQLQPDLLPSLNQLVTVWLFVLEFEQWFLE